MDTDEIIVTPKSTFEEYLFAQRALAQNAIPTSSRVGRYLVGGLLGAAIGFGLVVALNPAFLLLVAAIVIYIVFTGFTARSFSKSLYKRWVTDSGPLYFSDRGVRADDAGSKAEFEWDFFDRQVVSESSYVLVAKRGGFISIPKRDVPPEKATAFGELLARKLPI